MTTARRIYRTLIAAKIRDYLLENNMNARITCKPFPSLDEICVKFENVSPLKVAGVTAYCLSFQSTCFFVNVTNHPTKAMLKRIYRFAKRKTKLPITFAGCERNVVAMLLLREAYYGHNALGAEFWV